MNRERRYAWQVVAMLWLICLFNYADRQAIFSVFPKLQTEFGFDAVMLGFIGSAFTWLYAFGAPFAGFIGDRLPRKGIILGGCLFWSAVTATTALCAKLWQFIAVRALEGLGETFYFPASLSLMSDYHGPRTRSRALSVHQSSVYIGTIFGSAAGGWFAEYHGWRIAFYCFGLTGIVVALLLWRFLREPARGAAEDASADGAGPVAAAEKLSVSEALGIIFRRPAAWMLMLAFLGANFVATIFLTWTPTFLHDKFNFRLALAGLVAGVFIHLASAVSVPIGGWAADRAAARRPGGRILVQAAGLLGGAAFIAVVGLTSQVAWLLPAMLVFGFCKGIYDSNIWASFYDFIPARARGTASGVMNTVGWGGGALGPLFVGYMTKYGPRATQAQNMSLGIAAGAVIYLVVGLALVYIALRRAPQDIL